MEDLFGYWFLLPTILLLVFLKLFFFTKTKPKLNLPPSPPRLPIIGNLHQLGRNPHISLLNLARKHGPILRLNIGQVPTVVISSARLAKEVLKTHDLALASRPKIFGAKYLFYNCTDMAFSPYGPYWRYIRKVCILEVLSVKRVQSFSSVREEEVSRLIRRLAEPYPKPVNMSKVLGLYANDIVCRVSFGRDFTEGGDFDRKGFQKLLEEYQQLLGGLDIGDFFPSLESLIGFFSGTRSRLVRTSRKFDELFDQIVGEHLNPKREKLETVKDLVDVLLDIQRNGSGDDDISLTMDNVKALILDMFAAGTDTTFITLDWAMTEMITNPETLKKAQTEVREVLGDRRTVSETDIPKLHYMKAVIKETFRLHPPAPVLVPRESMDHVVIDGYDVPSKTRIFINAWAIGRDPESWEDPERFSPDRFMDSPIDFRGQDYELIPFGAGRRMCPAIAFGTAIVEIALAQILHSFDWELPRGVRAQDLDMTEVFGITMHRKYGLEVLAKPRFV